MKQIPRFNIFWFLQKKKRTESFGIKFGCQFLKVPSFLFPCYWKSHWNKVWFRDRLLLLNKHFVRSLRVTRSREHFKLCASLFSSYEYLVNLSIPVVLLRAYTLSKCIKMSLRCPPIMILIIITIIIIIIINSIIIIVTENVMKMKRSENATLASLK